MNIFLRSVVRRLRTTQTAGNFGISQKNSGSVPEFFCEIPEKIGCLCTRNKYVQNVQKPFKTCLNMFKMFKKPFKMCLNLRCVVRRLRTTDCGEFRDFTEKLRQRAGLFLVQRSWGKLRDLSHLFLHVRKQKNPHCRSFPRSLWCEAFVPQTASHHCS